MIQLKTRSTSHPCWISSPSRISTSGKAGHTVTDTGRKLQRIPHGKTTSKEVSKETLWKHSRSIYPRYDVQKDDDWVGSLWKCHPWNGSTCKRRPQSHCQRRRNCCLSWQLVDPLEFGEFRHDADKASTWLQESIVDIVPPQEVGGQRALWKLVAQLLLMVAMAHNLVGSLLWAFTTKMEWTLIERGNLCNQWTNYSFVVWISERIWCNIYRDYIGNSQRSLLSPTGGVKSTSPDTANHEQNGYVNYKNFIMTNVDNNYVWHKVHHQEWHEQSQRARSAQVSTAARRQLCFMSHWSCVTPHWLKSFACLSSSRHVAHVSFSLILFDLPFYFNLSFPVFFLSSVLMHPDLHIDLDNLDSVENNLRHSAKGSNDAYDVTNSLTVNPMFVDHHKKSNTTWIIPRLQCTRIPGKSQEHNCVLPKKTVTPHRAMSYVTPHLTTPSTCTPSLSSMQSSFPALHPLLSESKLCADLRHDTTQNRKVQTRLESSSKYCVLVYNTLHAICIEKVECMKLGEEPYNKVCQSPRVPQRAVLKPNLHHGRQDLVDILEMCIVAAIEAHRRHIPTMVLDWHNKPVVMQLAMGALACRQIHLTRHFSHAVCTIHFMHITLHGSSVCMRASFHLHVIHDERLIVVRLFVFVLLLFLYVVYLFSSLSYLYSDLHSFFHVDSAKGNNCCAFAQWGVLHPGDFPSSHRLWANVLEIFQEESGDIDTEPSYWCDAELDDDTIGKALSSPLFIQEREEPADRGQAYHSHEESLLSPQSFFAHARTGRPVHELSSC